MTIFKFLKNLEKLNTFIGYFEEKKSAKTIHFYEFFEKSSWNACIFHGYFRKYGIIYVFFIDLKKNEKNTSIFKTSGKIYENMSFYRIFPKTL